MYCLSMFKLVSEVHSRSTRSVEHLNLYLPRVQLVSSRRNIRYLGVVIWNALPHDLKIMDNVDTFKKAIQNVNVGLLIRLWIRPTCIHTLSFSMGFFLSYYSFGCILHFFLLLTLAAPHLYFYCTVFLRIHRENLYCVSRRKIKLTKLN